MVPFRVLVGLHVDVARLGSPSLGPLVLGKEDVRVGGGGEGGVARRDPQIAVHRAHLLDGVAVVGHAREPPAVVAVLRQQRADLLPRVRRPGFSRRPAGFLVEETPVPDAHATLGLSANQDLIAVRVLAHAGLAARDGVGRLHVRGVGVHVLPRQAVARRVEGVLLAVLPHQAVVLDGEVGRGRSRRSPATCSSSTEGSGAFRRRSPPTPLRCRNSAFPPPTSWGGWRGRTSFGEANFPTFWP